MPRTLTGFARYVTKPIEVEAIRWTDDTCEKVYAFLGFEHPDGPCPTSIALPNSGGQVALPGDWIVYDEGFFEKFTDERFRAEFERVSDV